MRKNIKKSVNEEKIAFDHILCFLNNVICSHLTDFDQLGHNLLDV